MIKFKICEFDKESIGYCGIYNKSLITLFNVEKQYSYYFVSG